MRRPSLRLVATVAALSPVSLVLSHDLSFLATYGVGSEAALRATGHEEGWVSAVRAVITISALLGAVGLVRLLALWRTARRFERESGTRTWTDWRDFVRTVLVIWASLVLVTAAWFLVQENVERLSIGQPFAGIAPLLGDGPIGPLLIIPGISLLVALVGGLFYWGIATLRARIAAAIAALSRRRPLSVGLPAGSDPGRSNPLSRNHGLRAPPPPLAV